MTKQEKVSRSKDSASRSESSRALPEIREKHVGTSRLRDMNKRELHKLSDVLIIHHHAEPLAALIPYETFMLWQARISDGARLLEKALTGVGVSEETDTV